MKLFTRTKYKNIKLKYQIAPNQIPEISSYIFSYNLFLKIKQITYPEEQNTQVYFIHHISKDYNGDYKWDKYISIINILYKELYQDSYSESELLNNLSKEISDRILYNENKLLFNKYI